MAAGFDIRCEQDLIAAMLQKEKYLLKVMSEIKPEDFTQTGLRQLFLLISDMYNENKPISIQSVLIEYREEIKKINLGTSYIMLASQLIMGGVDAMIEKLHEATKIRKLLQISDDIRVLANDDAKSEQILQNTENALSGLTATGVERIYISPKQMAESCYESMMDMKDAEKRKQKMLYTSFGKLNTISGGFGKGDLIILSAGTGVGKSAFAMNIAKEIGITQRRPVFYLNSEMAKDQMALRWDSYLAKVSHTRIRAGDIKAPDVDKVLAILDSVSNGKVHTLTIPDLQIANVVAEVRRAKMQHGIEVCIVDYIGRMDCSSADNDWKVLKTAAMKLKTMAQNLDMVVIMLAQLTDGNTLAQSSQMKQECDLWINLKEIEKEDQPQFAPWNMLLEIRKARNADKSNAISMRFNGDILAFTDDKTLAKKWYDNKVAEDKAKGVIINPAEQFGPIEPMDGKTKRYRKKVVR